MHLSSFFPAGKLIEVLKCRKTLIHQTSSSQIKEKDKFYINANIMRKLDF